MTASLRRASTAERPPLGLSAVAGVVGALFAFPALYLLWRNIAEGSELLDVLLSDRTLPPLWRTIRLAVVVSISASALGTTLAFLTTRTDVPLARVWRMVLPIPLVFPTFIGAAAFIRTLNPGGLMNDLLSGVGVDRTFELRGAFGAWLVLTLFTYPYVYLPVAARLRALPASLEETARVLGDSPRQAALRVVLPQLRTSISAGALLVFLYTISDFGAVQLMRYDTLTRSIEATWLSNSTVALALSLLLLALAAVFVVAERVVASRAAVEPLNRSGRVVRYPLGRLRIPAVTGVALVVAIAVGAPMFAIGDWAVDGLRRQLSGGRQLVVDAEAVRSATVNTLQISVVAAIATLVAVTPIALLVARSRSRLGTSAHAVVISTFALPGILVALALKFWVLRSDVGFRLLNESLGLLGLAYVIRFGSLALGSVLVAARSVPQRLHDAARTLGARWWRRTMTLDLPLMWPGLLAAAGLVLLSTMKELPIALLLSPIGFRTLTARIFDSFTEAFVAEAGVMAVILVAMSGVLSWLLVLRRADHL